MASYRRLLDQNPCISPVEQAQGFSQRRLRFNSNNACTEPSKGGHAVAHVCTDVEDKVARLHELAV